MRDREKTIVTLLMLLMLTVWLGFLLHRSPRFAGSLSGGILGVSGTILMLVPLAAYSVVKRVQTIKRRVTGWVSMKTLLMVHIYAAIIGSILILLHTGHKFESPLGMALTAMVLLVVISGFVGRYLMNHINQGLREKQHMLKGLQLGFEQLSQEGAHQSVEPTSIRSAPDRPWNWFRNWNQTEELVTSVSAVAGGIADLEYSIAVHSRMKSLFQKWHRFHLVISGVLFFVLALHLWSGVFSGWRWFP
ncbi:MAG: hypothetical protein O7G85_01205 [Planctomycetota bacterium]|nr:hypothetical protein [Planctomycetota bacterium]